VALGPGTCLGVYEILSLLGSGGMGEVWRARDTRLQRDVAIKVLPQALGDDPERLARFEREAQTLAALNHPNIAHIHGFEDSNGVPALVMELVEGSTLADSIARGPIPLDEAMPIAKQIAEGLEAAHEHGIIHRDLKPANVKVRADGTVKILDFGLAKALEPRQPANMNATRSPTITTPALMTGVGVILGTAAYMAPEQARGMPLDRRADIWAFGAVLFEMLTGRRAFEGDTVSDMLASVLKTDPDWRTLPAETPAALQRLLHRCLQKDPRRRLQAIGEARAQIEDVITGARDAFDPPPVPRPRPARSRVLPWTVAVVAIAVAAVLAILRTPWRAAAPRATVRMSAVPAADLSIAGAGFGQLALSPDGSTLAFVGAPGGTNMPQIFVRRLSELQATPLAGTANATTPFFSPDGGWIAFFAEGKLKRAPIAGGSVITIAPAPNGRGGWWGDDGSIVFAGDTNGILSRVPSAGGTPQAASTLVGEEVSHRWPQVIDDGKALLYSASASTTSWDTASIIGVRVPSDTRTVVQKNAYNGRYLPNGYLLFMRDGVEYGAPFDVERMTFKTPPVPLIDGILTSVATGGVPLAFAQNGTIVYLPGAAGGPATPIVWMNKAGETTAFRRTASDWSNPQFSPDGSRLAMDIRDDRANIDVFVYDWARDALSRLTFDPGIDEKPIWSPDGRWIVFASARGSTASVTNLYLQRADGGGEAVRLTSGTNVQLPTSWHPSGRFLAFTEVRPGTREDVMILPLEADDASGWKAGQPSVFLSTSASETEPVFSPDGHWIAYQSNQGGTTQVYVRPFPGPGGVWQVSTDGGSIPTWSRARQELLFRRINAPEVMAASYKTDRDTFVAEPARVWAPAFLATRPRQRMFDVHPDGSRIVAGPSTLTPATDKLVFVFNFFDEMKQLAR
jgi:serine/threonine-protein kinase